MGYFSIDDLRRSGRMKKRSDQNQSGKRTPKYSNKPSVQRFFEEHGNHVTVANLVIFEDGAVLEASSNGFGGMRPPSDDLYERSKVIHRYWEIVARRADLAFRQFQSYLHGSGACPPEIHSEEDKLNHLKSLKAAAASARSNLRKAGKTVEDETPAWQIAKKRENAEEAMRRNEFMTQVDSIRL